MFLSSGFQEVYNCCKHSALAIHGVSLGAFSSTKFQKHTVGQVVWMQMCFVISGPFIKADSNETGALPSPEASGDLPM